MDGEAGGRRGWSLRCPIVGPPFVDRHDGLCAGRCRLLLLARHKHAPYASSHHLSIVVTRAMVSLMSRALHGGRL